MAESPLDKVFSGLPDPLRAQAQFFDNPRYCGIVIGWAEKGTGFGEITLSFNKETQLWGFDVEYMSPAFVAKVFKTLQDAQPRSAANSEA